MIKKVLILILLTSLNLGTSFAHEDFGITKKFNNVTIRVVTGFDYEEINKIFIIGQFAAKLSEKLKYRKNIFLDFQHNYVGDCVPDYFISYDDGSIIMILSDGESKWSFMESKAIVIRQISRIYDIPVTMKLLEYAIINKNNIKTNQTEIEYNKNYHHWRINSIDASTIIKIVKAEPSSIVESVLENKIFRPESDDFSAKNGISYFYQNNKFFVYAKRWGDPDKIVLELENIYQFERLPKYSALVFDTPDSFYFIDNPNQKLIISKHHIIKDAKEYYEPYYTKRLTEGTVEILMDPYLDYNNRNFVYYRDVDRLIEYYTQQKN